MQDSFFNNLVSAYADWHNFTFDQRSLYRALGFDSARLFDRNDVERAFAYLNQQR